MPKQPKFWDIRPADEPLFTRVIRCVRPAIIVAAGALVAFVALWYAGERPEVRRWHGLEAAGGAVALIGGVMLLLAQLMRGRWDRSRLRLCHMGGWIVCVVGGVMIGIGKAMVESRMGR